VGKTWATLAWLVERANAQPIVLLIASSAIAKDLASISVTSVKRFLAARLYEVPAGFATLSIGYDAWSICLSDPLTRVRF
jgi:phosphoglucomutase